MKKSLITLLILSLAAFAAVSAYAQDDEPQDGTDQTTPDSSPNDDPPPAETPDEQQPAENPDEPQPSGADPVETGSFRDYLAGGGKKQLIMSLCAALILTVSLQTLSSARIASLHSSSNSSSGSGSSRYAASSIRRSRARG